MIDFTFEQCKKAIQIYMDIAYEGNEPSHPNVKNKLNKISNTTNLDELLEVFQKESINGHDSYKIQLGSQHYPFLKLVIEQSSFNNTYSFYVDRHSEYIAVDSNSPTFKKELELKNKTKKLKIKIEEELDKNNLQTYRNLVKEYVRNVKKEKIGRKKGKIILLVEDDHDINEMHALELSIFGYEVVTVDNGYDAIKQVENKYFDLMFLDLMMSGISGQEVIKNVGKDVDIIVLSALTDAYTEKTCIDLGAKGYISKPASRDYLKKYLEDYFNKGE